MGTIHIQYQPSHTDDNTSAARLLRSADKAANRLRQQQVRIPPYLPCEDLTYLLAPSGSMTDIRASQVLSAWRKHLKMQQTNRVMSQLGACGPNRQRVDISPSHSLFHEVLCAQGEYDLLRYFRMIRGLGEELPLRFVIAAVSKNLPLHGASRHSGAYQQLPQCCPLCSQPYERDHRWHCPDDYMRGVRAQRKLHLTNELRHSWPDHWDSEVSGTLLDALLENIRSMTSPPITRPSRRLPDVLHRLLRPDMLTAGQKLWTRLQTASSEATNLGILPAALRDLLVLLLP